MWIMNWDDGFILMIMMGLRLRLLVIYEIVDMWVCYGDVSCVVYWGVYM